MWSRRQMLGSAAALGLFFATRRVWAGAPLRFESVAPSEEDRLIVPKGYRAEVLLGWGDSLGIEAGTNGTDRRLERAAPTPELQAITAGTGHDGLELFPLGRDRFLVALNHEFAELKHLFAGRGKEPFSAREVELGLLAQGVSIFEISRRNGRWQVVPSKRARRITGMTPMVLSGPAAGSHWLVTSADPLGRHVFGTFANCATGKTPWGTLLTCEENFDDYFYHPAPDAPDARGKRYGLRDQNVYPWHQAHARFDGRLEPHEPHRFGWVVEVDPMDPNSVPVKRTALGRFKHETASVRLDPDGSLALYMGDDEAFEHLYKFVPEGRYIEGKGTRDHADLLDRGTLYVARFDEGGRGEWLPLVHQSKSGGPLGPDKGFADQADVLVFARLAATALWATPLDRPEWIAIDPVNGDGYAALTNNVARGLDGAPGVDAANPFPNNIAGHILRWHDPDVRATRFTWDIGLIGGATPSGKVVSSGDGFVCPDALRFGADGRLWIGTDAPSLALELNGLGHNALLCVDPASGQVRRFLTAPRGAEVSGIQPTDDGRTLLVSIQHPSGNWPDGEGAPPRSALVVVTRDDGGKIA